MVEVNSTRKKKRPAPTRRTLLRAGAAGAAILAAPALISRRASAAEPLKVVAWKGYVTDEMLETFKNRTGIEVALTSHDGDQFVLDSWMRSDKAIHDMVCELGRGEFSSHRSDRRIAPRYQADNSGHLGSLRYPRGYPGGAAVSPCRSIGAPKS